jgi:hypothetical protein
LFAPSAGNAGRIVLILVYSALVSPCLLPHTRRRLKPEAPGEDSAEVLGNELEAREDPDATRA